MSNKMEKVLSTSLPSFTLFNMFINKPLTVFLTAVPIVSAPIVDIRSAGWLLFWLFLADLITGTYASYCDWRKDKKKKERWFFGKGEGFSSDKFKKMGVKAIVYGGCPYFMIKFQETFMIKNLKYESLSEAEVTVATFFILLFCLNEGFSIFNENLPRCGFDLFDRIKKIGKAIVSTKKSFEE